MKKLLFIAAALAMVSVCCASTVKWNVNNIYTCDSTGKGKTGTSDKPAKDAYYVMCFLASDYSLADATKQLAKGASGIDVLSDKAAVEGKTTNFGGREGQTPVTRIE